MLANPAMRSHAVATGQQTGTSGTIPGTSSDPTQLATLSGTIQSYPDGPSPNGDQVAGVGHQVLNNAGNPVVVMGNLNAVSGGGGSKLPSSFQDGGFAFVDADGNFVAGYSQSTGLFGFGGTTGVVLSTFGDEVRGSGVSVTAGGRAIADCTGASSTSWFDPSTGEITEPGLYLAIPGVTVQTAGSAADQYAWWSSDFDFQTYVPLDGLNTTFPAPGGGTGLPTTFSNAQSLGPFDVPYYVSTGLYLPSSATGWELTVNMVIGRLAYST